MTLRTRLTDRVPLSGSDGTSEPGDGKGTSSPWLNGEGTTEVAFESLYCFALQPTNLRATINSPVPNSTRLPGSGIGTGPSWVPVTCW